MITAVRVFDTDVIKSVMLNPEIWATVAEDGQRPEMYSPDPESSCWLAMMTETGELAGVYVLHALSSAELEIHAHVLPEFRKTHSFDTGVSALRWVSENAGENYQKVTACVPDIYPNVQRFVIGQGFQHEGTKRKAYRKDGELHDLRIYGITRAEIEGLFHE